MAVKTVRDRPNRRVIYEQAGARARDQDTAVYETIDIIRDYAIVKITLESRKSRHFTSAALRSAH